VAAFINYTTGTDGLQIAEENGFICQEHNIMESARITRDHERKRQPGLPFADFDAIFAQRKQEADEYYRSLQPVDLDEETRRVQRPGPGRHALEQTILSLYR
jgi:hypothetical protein